MVKIEDLTDRSLRDCSVAKIISIDTLEHIEDYTKALSELFRVLAEDGQAIFHVPCYYFEKPRSEPIQHGVDPWGHLGYFSGKELISNLAKVGFIILRVKLQFDYGSLVCLVQKKCLYRWSDWSMNIGK